MQKTLCVYAVIQTFPVRQGKPMRNSVRDEKII